MIRIKAGVQPRNLVIAAAVANVGHEMDVDVVITSGTDGQHMQGSKHYTGEALDIRLVANEAEFVQRLGAHLGANYQLIVERDHLHVEYDPSAATATVQPSAKE